jgi:hypothetical protein
MDERIDEVYLEKLQGGVCRRAYICSINRAGIEGTTDKCGITPLGIPPRFSQPAPRVRHLCPVRDPWILIGHHTQLQKTLIVTS